MKADSTRAPEGATTFTTKDTWAAAFAAWEAAKADYDFAEAAYETAHKEAGGGDEADNNPGVAKLCELMDERAASENDTRFALILTPAPDFSAVTWKLTSLYGAGDYDGDDHSSAWHHRYPAAVIADMERLQSEFANAWLSAWTKAGGSVVIDDEGEAHFGYPTYDLAPNCVQSNPDLPSEMNENAFLHAQADYYATMRERFNLLKALPGSADAIKAHMRAKGIRVAVHTTEQGK